LLIGAGDCYFNFIYDRMAAVGAALLGEPSSTDNVRRMDSLDRFYRRLGGIFTAVADIRGNG
jgi:hypothetical protein